MALAVGSMGMSLKDFDSLTPRQFRSVLDAWQRVYIRQPWEQTRMLACCLLQPWSKKQLRPADVLRFEWDAPEKKEVHPAEQSTRQRFEEIRRRAGM